LAFIGLQENLIMATDTIATVMTSYVSSLGSVIFTVLPQIIAVAVLLFGLFWGLRFAFARVRSALKGKI